MIYINKNNHDDVIRNNNNIEYTYMNHILTFHHNVNNLYIVNPKI